jgi:hypothetical protein
VFSAGYGPKTQTCARDGLPPVWRKRRPGGVEARRSLGGPQGGSPEGGIQPRCQSLPHLWEEAGETERLPVEPDALFTLHFNERQPDAQLAHFFYEADRGSMVMTDMLKKFRGYFHFIKKQRRHREAFGVHPIRAVLVETTDEARGQKLMQLVNHPLVAGPARRAGLFWFSISPFFTDLGEGSLLPRYLERPGVIFDQIWALPDRTLHAVLDSDN